MDAGLEFPKKHRRQVAVFRLNMTKSMTQTEAEEYATKIQKWISRVSITLIVLGVVFLISSLLNIYYGITSKDWPLTQAVVTESFVSKSNADSHSQTKPGNRRVVSFSPIIKYAYSVDGEIFENDEIRFSAIGGSSQTEARRYVYKYPKGKRITIYYSSFSPKKSVIEPGLTNINGGAIAGALFLVLMGFSFHSARKIMADPQYFVGK